MEPIYFEDETGGCNAGVLENNQEKEEFVIWNRFAKPQGFGAGVPVFLQDNVFLVFLSSWPGFSKSITSNLETNAILLSFLYPLTTFTTSANNLPVPFLPVIFHIATVILEQMKRNHSESSMPLIERYFNKIFYQF